MKTYKKLMPTALALGAFACINAMEQPKKTVGFIGGVPKSIPTYVEILNVQLPEKTDINSPIDELGQTALHLAVNADDVELCNNLILNKADVNSRGISGALFSPLLVAASGDKTICKLLLAHKANINDTTSIGTTVLEMASDDKEVTKLILSYGASSNNTLILRYLQELKIDTRLFFFPCKLFLKTKLKPYLLRPIAVIVINYVVPTNLADLIACNTFEAQCNYNRLHIPESSAPSSSSASLTNTQPSAPATAADGEQKHDENGLPVSAGAVSEKVKSLEDELD